MPGQSSPVGEVTEGETERTKGGKMDGLKEWMNERRKEGREEGKKEEE